MDALEEDPFDSTAMCLVRTHLMNMRDILDEIQESNERVDKSSYNAETFLREFVQKRYRHACETGKYATLDEQRAYLEHVLEQRGTVKIERGVCVSLSIPGDWLLFVGVCQEQGFRCERNSTCCEVHLYALPNCVETTLAWKWVNSMLPSGKEVLIRRVVEDIAKKLLEDEAQDFTITVPVPPTLVDDPESRREIKQRLFHKFGIQELACPHRGHVKFGIDVQRAGKVYLDLMLTEKLQ